MSLAWYLKRLSNMSPAEIAHRVVEQAKRSASRQKAYGWAAFASDSAKIPSIPGLAAALVRGASAERRTAIAEASARVLAGEFSALGMDWPRRPAEALFPPSVWSLDPVTGKAWRNDQFCFDIAYRHERELGDIKYVWEFNRLQFLQPLAAQVALADDPQALKALNDAIGSWHGANPPFRGLGWNSGIEVGLRAASLIVVTSLCGEKLSVESQRQIREILAASLYWLTRFPSGFSSANNHLIAEAVGEFLICLSMPWAPNAERHRVHAAQVLEVESQKQIFADGAPAEQSPTYGAFSAEMLLIADLAGRLAGAPLKPDVERQLKAFAAFVLWLSNVDGSTPAIGDDDEGRVLTLCAHEKTYADSVAAAILGMYGASAEGLVEKPRLELRDALFSSPAGGGEPLSGARTFANGGYTVVQESRAARRARLVIDHGPLGYLAIAAHGHADANALTLTIDGHDVIVDPGTYLYHSGGEWRDWFRGTRSHSTVTVNGADQSIISGPFNWSHKANGKLELFEDGGASGAWRLQASHDGYKGRFGVTHVRTLEADERGYVVVDRLDAASAGSEPEVEVVFQLAADIEALAIEGGYRLSKQGVFLADLLLDAAGGVSVTSGGALGEGGWVSPQFGVKTPAPRISWRGRMPKTGVRTLVRLG
ncbi:alginate lyase family protein [Caulobacter segnis]|uniref:Heparinase n=1 Tax=Caulobacter segnis TaxID=88688 RepID=A0A2W5X5U7_9CAUL|nr:alginate lyase family protein [Caulobacter segnis]PZR32161.1 MAG: heparinase [Caulobacter segnis]